ncbi:M13 family metallopeptidase [Zhihengliuella somnathii]
MSTETPAAEAVADYRDHAVRPQDDLYRHVNGKWLSTATIPADLGSYGSFMKLRDDSELAVHALIEEAQAAVEAGTADARQQRIAALYGSFMDEERIEATGAQPIAEYLDRIDAVATREDFVTLIGEYQRRGIDGFYHVAASNDAGSPERNLLTFIQSGLGLPDESYYRDDQYAGLVEEYRQHLARFLALARRPDADRAAAVVLDLERELAGHHWDKVKTRDAKARYNLLTEAELTELHPAVKNWLAGAGIEPRYFAEVDVWQPSYLEGLEKVLASRELDDWKQWAVVQVLRSFAPYLSSDFVAEHFAFYSAKLGGVEEQKERWKRGVAFTEGGVGEDIGQLYVERHFPGEAKERMDALVAQLIEAYRRSISELPWMSRATRERALEKLSMFRPKIGYPVKWIDYSPIAAGSDVIANVAAVNEFDFARELQKIDDGVDRDLWFMFPQTVNAYYHPLLNEIAFPAAILRPPFFGVDRDAASNFGAIGAVIGHEIGHGFDDQGSQFDGTGELKNWWTDEDRERFEELTGRLVDQYEALVPPEAPEHHVNGRLTLGENIGDLGGLGIAYQAYRIDADERGVDITAEGEDGLTGEQRFFYAWAECWRSLTRSETMVTRIATDPHSPAEFRCNQVARNLDAFHRALGTQPGDGMWLDPAERVTIW